MERGAYTYDLLGRRSNGRDERMGLSYRPAEYSFVHASDYTVDSVSKKATARFRANILLEQHLDLAS